MPKEGSFIAIDKHNLDEEWVEQPRRFRKYSRLLAEATKAVGLAKAKLELVAAEISVDIKMNPQAFGFKAKAPTDATVKSMIIMDKRYQKAQQALVDAKYQEDLLQADVNGLAQKKSALQDLVILEVQDYWAEPRVKGGENNEAVKERIEAKKRKEHYARGRLNISKKKVKSDD